MVDTLGGDLSLEQITAAMSDAEQDEVLAGLELEELPYDWHWIGRPSQILPVLPEDGGNDWSRTLLLGGRGMGKTCVCGVDSIDVSDVDTSLLGHSYYGDNGSVVSDIRRLLSTGLGPDRRCGLRAVTNTAAQYWTFVAHAICPVGDR